MTETSYPFKQPADDNPYGKTMTEKQWAAMFRYIWPTGIMAVSFNDSLNQLEVTPDASLPLTVDVDTGAAGIQGFAYLNDAVKTITLAQNSSSGIRADLIVLELKWGLDAGIHAIAISGDNGVTYPSSDPRSGQPMPKELDTVYEVKWQVPLCQINVPQGTGMISSAMITDMRKFVGSGGAQAYAVTVAMGNASDAMRDNAQFQIPANAGYIDADTIIMEAFDALPSCGGTVMLSEGDCVISGSITPPANAILAGCGEQSTISLDPSAGAAPMISITQDNVVVRDLLLNGQAAAPTSGTGGTLVWPAQTAAHGIKIIDANNAKLNTITVQNMKGNGIEVVESGYLEGLDIANCKITNAWGIGIHPTGNYGTVESNKVTGCGLAGLTLYAPSGLNCNGNEVNNNKINGCGADGMDLDGGQGGTLLYNMFSNNHIGQCGMRANNVYDCISVWGSSSSNIDKNSFLGNYAWTAGAPSTVNGLGMQTHCGNVRAVGNDLADSGSGYDILVVAPGTGTTLLGRDINCITSHSP